MKKGAMLSKMIVLATNAHAGQFDRGGNPYILHPLRVMYYIDSKDEDIQIMAIGHDLIEDTTITLEDLHAHGFNDRVINGIQALTKQNEQSYDEYKAAIFANVDAMIVKMADLRDNSDIRRLKGVSDKDNIRMAKYFAFYKEISERLGHA